jgi:ketosteroid isomerase-like protein
MASENLYLARSIFAAWERGDFSSAEWAHPGIEVVAVDGPDPGSWTGLPAVVNAFRNHLSAFGEYRVEVDEYRELDGGRVLVLVHASGRGKTSGLQAGNNGANLFHVARGKVTRLVLYWDRERAFAELGLAPEANTP